MKETVEAIKKSGKARFVGFSSHDGRRAEYLEAAAAGKVFDVVMIQNTAWLDKNTRLNKAIDRCHAAGIGLISMKQLAARPRSLPGPGCEEGARPDRAGDHSVRGAPARDLDGRAVCHGVCVDAEHRSGQ